MIKQAKKKIKDFKNGKHYKSFDTFKNHGYIQIFAANMIARLSTTGFPLLIAFFLTSYEVGAIKIFLSYTAFFGIIAGLGIEAGIVRYCSSAKEKVQQNNIFGDLFIIGFLYSCIISGIIAIIAGFRIFSQDQNITNMILIGCLSIPFAASTLYSASYLQAQTKFKEYAKLNVSFNILMLPVLLFSTIMWGLTGFTIVFCLTYGIMALVMLNSAYKEFYSHKIINIKKTFMERILEIKFSLFSMLANSAGQLNYTLDVIMMSALSVSTQEIGIYGVAQILVFGSRQLIMAANQISIPVLSKKFSEDKETALDHYKKHRTLITLLSLILLIGGLIFAPIIPILLGQQYQNAIIIFIILLTAQVFWSQYSIRGITLLAYGRNDLNLYLSLSVLIVNVVFNYVFISSWGIIGAALAMLATFMLTSIISIIMFKKAKVFENNEEQ